MKETPKLTVIERMYFDALMKHEEIVPRSIFEAIHDDYPNSNVVDVHIGNLRKKLAGIFIIESVRGVGYKIIKI